MLRNISRCRRSFFSGSIHWYRSLLLLPAVLAVFATPLPSFASVKYSSHTQMMRVLTSLEFVDEWFGQNRLRVECIGKSRRGKDIPLVILSQPETISTAQKQLFIICRQHGDEPATTEAMLNLIKQMTLQPTSLEKNIASSVTLFIVPMMNPDGASRLKRENAANTDLNRDWLRLSQPETQAVNSAILTVQPDVVIDAHELGPYNHSEGDYIEVVGWSAGADPDLVSDSIMIQQRAISELRKCGLKVRCERVKDHNSPRLAHRCLPLISGIKTMLVESRQTGTRAKRLDVRIMLHKTAVLSVAGYLAGINESEHRKTAPAEPRGYARTNEQTNH